MITAGGTGGMLICKSEEDAERASFLALQAKEPVPWYEHKELGYNYRMANSNAAFGFGQMQDTKTRLAYAETDGMEELETVGCHILQSIQN